jgi:hypothetical protein
VTLPKATSDSYTDPRLSGVKLVDYSDPGAAVVWVDRPPLSDERVDLEIRTTPLGVRLAPSLAVVGIGGWIQLMNRSGQAQTISVPEEGWVRVLEPGERIEWTPPAPGERSVFLLGDSSDELRLFVSPGRHARVAAGGRWELPDLAPGPARLSAWHPRLPGPTHELEVTAGEVARVDLEVGVDALHPDPGTSADGGADASR